MIDLDALQAAAEAATPGPWVQWDDGDVGTGYPVTRQRRRTGELVTSESSHIATTMHKNAAFIAAANPAAILEFVAAHRAALSRIARVEALHERKVAYRSRSGKTVVAECLECSEHDFDGWVAYPCPTVRALTGGEPDAVGQAS